MGYAIAEGSAARFALVGIPNQWCHKACAEDWELAVRSGAPGAAPVPIEQPCGAPHPEVKGVSCTRVAHPGGNHLDGHGGGWYMDAKEVEALKANIAALSQPEAAEPPTTGPALYALENAAAAAYAAGHQAGVDNTRIGERQDLWVDGPTTPHGRTEEHTLVINAIDAVTGVRPEQDLNWNIKPPPLDVIGGPTEAELAAFDEPEEGDGAQVVLDAPADGRFLADVDAAIEQHVIKPQAGIKVTSTTPGSNVTTIHRVQTGRIDLGAAVTRLQAECDLMRDALGDAGIDVEDLLGQGHP